MFWFFKGCIVGISISMPIGPIGLLCINRALASGAFAGIATGFGAAVAELIVGITIVSSLASLLHVIFSHQLLVRSIGGIFLLAVGLKVYFTKHVIPLSSPDVGETKMGMFKAFLSTFLIMLFNPITFGTLMAIFAGVGITALSHNIFAIWMFIGGMFAGSMAMWIVISSTIGIFHKKITSETLKRINQVCGLLIIIFGFYVIATLFTHTFLPEPPSIQIRSDAINLLFFLKALT